MEDDKICIVTEASDLSYQFNRTSIYSFITTNKWFDGTIYLLTNNEVPLSYETYKQLSCIYSKIKVVDTSYDDSFTDLINLIKLKNKDYSQIILNYLKFYAFNFNAPGVLYFSRYSLFLNSISDLITPDSLSASLLSTSFPGTQGEELSINSSIFYASKNNLSTSNYSNLIELAKIYKVISPISDFEIFNVYAHNFENLKIYPNTVVANYSNFIDRKYIQLSKYLKVVKAINYSNLNDGTTFLKIRALWFQLNKEATLYLAKPSVYTNIPSEYDIDMSNTLQKRYDNNIIQPSKHKETIDLSNIKISGKIKLAIVTGIWKRPEIFEMFAKGIKKLVERFGNELEIHTIVAGSEGAASKNLVEAHNFTYIEIPNMPLSAKMNSTVLKAKELKVDYVLCLGSDDILSPDLLSEYIKYMRCGIDYIGVTDFYFYDTVTRKAAYWGGYQERYRRGHTCGAGRILSNKLLDIWGWKIWEIKNDNMLDTSMQYKLNTTKHTSAVFSIKEKNLFGLDIKSSTNMTPFKLWDNTQYIDEKIILEKFNYIGL